MKHSGITLIPLLILLFIALVSCKTNDPYKIEPPDFSTVPEPYDTTSVNSTDLEDGVRVYIYDEGYGPFVITPRDQITLYITLRTDSSDIIYSTFASSNTSPETISMTLADGMSSSVHTAIDQAPYNYSIYLTHTPGLKEGLLGMQNGEKVTLVVSPEKGYKNIPTDIKNQSYKDSTLIYDVLISDIGPKKTQ